MVWAHGQHRADAVFGGFSQALFVGIGLLELTFVVVVAVNRLVQGRAVLVGNAHGPFVIHPLGLHRFSKGARLSGDLGDAWLTAGTRPGSGPMQPPSQVFTVIAGDRKLEFSLAEGLANEDHQDRFREWLSWYENRTEG